MPEESQREVDVEGVNRWLAARVATLDRRHVCPVCGTDGWTVQPDFAATPVVFQNSVDLRQGWPMVVLFCNHCAHVQFFSARQMGVYPFKVDGTRVG